MAKAATTTNTSARSEARGAATASTKRTPSPRDESTGTDAAVQSDTTPAPSAASQMPIVLIAPNPKRKGSKAFGFYEMYGKPGVLTNLEAIRQAGVRGKDVSWDRDRRHILAGEEAAGFPIDGSREEQATYLRGLPASAGGVVIGDKELIAWGYMDAPVAVVEDAKEAVAASDAKAANA